METLCFGGPLDGQMVTTQDRCAVFEATVVLLPPDASTGWRRVTYHRRRVAWPTLGGGHDEADALIAEGYADELVTDKLNAIAGMAALAYYA